MPLKNSDKNTDLEKKPRKGSQQYMKYAGLATTMFATLFIAFWLGSKVDQYLGNETEYVGLVFVVATLVAIFYKLLKELS